MSTQYKVLVVGMGKRGMHHARLFHANPRFKVVGMCDIDRATARRRRPSWGIPAIGADAAELAGDPEAGCVLLLHPAESSIADDSGGD